jgi:hypothetical protein
MVQSEILGFAPEALREKLAEIVADSGFPRSPALFAEWLRRVSRFSFEIGRTIMPASSLRKQTSIDRLREERPRVSTKPKSG